MTEQWVNLEKRAALREAGERDDNRLGTVCVEVVVAPGGDLPINPRLVPNVDNLYTPAEQARNPNFTLRPRGTRTITSSGSTTYQYDYDLPAAGGVEYQAVAEFAGTTRKTGEPIQTRRKLFYQEMAMRGIHGFSLDSLKQRFWSPENKYFIRLEKPVVAGVPIADGVIDLVSIDTTTGIGNFKTEVRRQYRLQPYEPHAFVVAWVGSIATGQQIGVRQDVPRDSSSRVHFWDRTGALQVKLTSYLWHGFDTAEDATKSWFISGKWLYKDATRTLQEQVIERRHVEISGRMKFKYGGYRQIRISTAPPAGVTDIKVDLQLKVVADWSGGLSIGNSNVIAVASRGKWQDLQRTVCKRILIHEIGHKIGMVADGNGRSPDRTRGQYDALGHHGSHCSKGMTFSTTWSGTPGCVMFGTVRNGIPKAFCSDCARAVRKLDLGDNLPGFTSIMRFGPPTAGAAPGPSTPPPPVAAAPGPSTPPSTTPPAPGPPTP